MQASQAASQVTPQHEPHLTSLLYRPTCKEPGFTGQLLDKPRSIVLLMLMGFEVSFSPLMNLHLSTGGHPGDRPKGAVGHGGCNLSGGIRPHSQGGEQ